MMSLKSYVLKDTPKIIHTPVLRFLKFTVSEKDTRIDWKICEHYTGVWEQIVATNY